jgi:hypothetical protein
MDIQLLKPSEVDLLFRYPAGRALKLAKVGRIPHIVLPDGEIRFDEAEIRRLLNPTGGMGAKQRDHA